MQKYMRFCIERPLDCAGDAALLACDRWQEAGTKQVSRSKRTLDQSQVHCYVSIEPVSDQVSLPPTPWPKCKRTSGPAMEFAHAAEGSLTEESHQHSLLWEQRERPGEADDCCTPLEVFYCCTGFPSGVWMDNWAANLPDAVQEAQRVAARPAIGWMLEVLGRGEALPFATSELVNARLLDLAILIGNKEVAHHLAKLGGSRPLRRWRSSDLVRWTDDGLQLWDPAVLSAALSAGVDLSKLRWKGPYGALPFRDAVALSGWPNLGLPATAMSSLTRLENRLGEYLMVGRALCFQRLQKAVEAGVPVRDFRLLAGAFCATVGFAVHPTLLDMAIWGGQRDCAVLCASVGVEFEQERSKERLARRETPFELRSFSIAPPVQRLAAARAAGVAALQLSWRRAREKGVAVSQHMKAKMGRPFPKELVDEVLAYSMDVPLIIERLDLWDQMPDWHPRKGFAACD